MTYSDCLADAQDLKAAMGRWGVRCSIELQAGRGADPWASIRKYLRMEHHTASWFRVGGSLTPILAVVKNGRSDVPGPLANGYGGYDLVYRIICMGEANHPGLGGPLKIDGVYVPKDSARKPTWGTEWEGGYQTWEEIDRLGPDMLQFMGRASCALAEWSGRPLTSLLEHKTWAPTRKVDRKDFDAGRVRAIALTRRWYEIVKGGGAAPTPGGFMAALTEAQQGEMYSWMKAVASATVPVYQTKYGKRNDPNYQVQRLVSEAIHSDVAPLIAKADDGSGAVWLVDRQGGTKLHLRTWDAVGVAVYMGANDLGPAAGGKRVPHLLSVQYMDNLADITPPVDAEGVPEI